jgi:hypothetical protein
MEQELIRKYWEGSVLCNLMYPAKICLCCLNNNTRDGSQYAGVPPGILTVSLPVTNQTCYRLNYLSGLLWDYTFVGVNFWKKVLIQTVFITELS